MRPPYVLVCFAVLASGHAHGDRDERCYDEAGCLSLEEIIPNPIYRIGASYPEDRGAVNTTFYVHTRANRYDSIHLSWSSTEEDIGRMRWDASKPTKFIVHGYGSSADAKWIADTKNAYLNAADYNVVLVSWHAGLKYRQAVVNSHLVGGEVAAFIRKLHNVHGVDAQNVHIVGHSLGAHVAGRTGYMLQNSTMSPPGRITGLDPAGPLFEDQDEIVRLDSSDASFVDVIHTDASALISLQAAGFGLKQAMGHIDFYPNGGEFMPGCGLGENIKAFFESIISDEEISNIDIVTCNHKRSQGYMTESIENESCIFWAFECDSYEKFQRGECSDCGEDSSKCAPMGEPADRWTGKRDASQQHRMYLHTRAEPPYCVFQYRVTIKRYLDDTEDVEVDQLNLTVHGSSGKEEFRVITEPTTLEVGCKRSVVVHARADLGKIKNVYLETDGSQPLSFSYVELQAMTFATRNEDSRSQPVRYRLPKTQKAVAPRTKTRLRARGPGFKKQPYH